MDPEFQQNFSSRTAKDIYRMGHDSVRRMKCRACYDRYYENLNYFDLMSSSLSCLNGTS